jgi:hypothetical protein
MSSNVRRLVKRSLWLLTVAVCLSPYSDSITAAQPPTDQQVVRYVPGRQISAVARGGNTGGGAGSGLVILRDYEVPDLFVPPEFTFIAWKTIVYPVAAVVRVTQTSAVITPAGDWIETRVRGVVEQVLKNSTATPLVERSPLEFRTSGGVVSVNDRRVIAAFEGVRPLDQGKSYLVFASAQADGTLHVPAYSAFEFVEGRLQSLVSANTYDPIHVAADPETVFQEIRAYAAFKNPRRKQ